MIWAVQPGVNWSLGRQGQFWKDFPEYYLYRNQLKPFQDYLLDLEFEINGYNNAHKTELVPIPVRQKDVGLSLQQLNRQYYPVPLQEEWMMAAGCWSRGSQALGAGIYNTDQLHDWWAPWLLGKREKKGSSLSLFKSSNCWTERWLSS